MNRTQIAERITCGLGGWLQMLAAQDLHPQAGEDAARVITLQILNSQNAYRPTAAAKPTNWGSSKKRIDIALKGTSQQAAGWYGAFELKWAAESSDPHQILQAIVQDAARLSFVETTNMCVLVVGGAAAAITTLFDTPHPNAIIASRAPGLPPRRNWIVRRFYT